MGMFDMQKFCADLYDVLHNADLGLAAKGVCTTQDLRRAVNALKEDWQNSTEGKHFAQLSREDRAHMESDLTRLYDDVEKKTPTEIFVLMAEMYSKAAWIQSGHLLTSLHAKKLEQFGQMLRQMEEFKTLSADLRASVEVAEERFHTGEKQFSTELRIWWDEEIVSFEHSLKKLSSTDKAVIGSALAKAKKKITAEFDRGLLEPKNIESEMVLLLHEISEHMHKKGGEKSIREADPESILLALLNSVKKSVEELKVFVKREQVNL